jgi:hypothetical protein
LITESALLVLYGSAAEASGGLFPGRIELTVEQNPRGIDLRTLKMCLVSMIDTKKPFSRRCSDCSSRTEEILTHSFLSLPAHLDPGVYSFPFSLLIPGNLPPSCQGQLGAVKYIIECHATTSTDENIILKTPLLIQRETRPGHSRCLVRSFPPSATAARVVLPSIVHPSGSFPIKITLRGLVENRNTNEPRRWWLHRIIWQIEEHQQILSTPCSRHTIDSPAPRGKGIGKHHHLMRIIGRGETERQVPPATDLPDNQIEIRSQASIDPQCKPLCSIRIPRGLEIKHELIIEMVILEQLPDHWRSVHIGCIGDARILRMRLSLLVAKCRELGLRWDEEIPPPYKETDGPPNYQRVEERLLVRAAGSTVL